MIELIASNPLVRISVLIVLFAVVVAVTVVTMTRATKRMAVKGELRSLVAGVKSDGQIESLASRRDGGWERLADRIEQAGLSLTDTKPDTLRDTMRSAGFDSPVASRIYTLVRLILVFALPALFVLFTLVSGSKMGALGLYGFGSLAAVMGLYVPALVVRAMADRRREAIVNGFPDCLDLMLVCVEAGLGLEAALDRVGREMVASHPLESHLLSTATLQLRAGSTREAALKRMAEDAGVDEISSFATLLIQSDRLGTSIAKTLRVYAAEMRERRRMRAEEKAHRLPVLISIPLVICMLPVMIGVLMLPAAIRVIREVLPAMQGG